MVRRGPGAKPSPRPRMGGGVGTFGAPERGGHEISQGTLTHRRAGACLFPPLFWEIFSLGSSLPSRSNPEGAGGGGGREAFSSTPGVGPGAPPPPPNRDSLPGRAAKMQTCEIEGDLPSPPPPRVALTGNRINALGSLRVPHRDCPRSPALGKGALPRHNGLIFYQGTNIFGNPFHTYFRSTGPPSKDTPTLCSSTLCTLVGGRGGGTSQTAGKDPRRPPPALGQVLPGPAIVEEYLALLEEMAAVAARHPLLVRATPSPLLPRQSQGEGGG